MKRFIKAYPILLVLLTPTFLLLNFSCAPSPRDIPGEAHTTVTFQVFYDELSPYGHWIQNPTYGYVWLPMDDPDFLPYSTHGHWVWTDYGWTWVSEYPWGWAPFHYGRWDFDPGYGWFWVPNNVWGPAWVVWREYPGYYGWAPLGPGIGITIVIGGGYFPPEPWWTFCDREHFGRHDMQEHFHPRRKIGRIRDGESRVIDNTFKEDNGTQVFLMGPGRDNVQTESGEPVERVKIESNNKPGESFKDGTWSVYHPEIEPTSASQPQPLPRSVTPAKDIQKSNPVVPPVIPLPTPGKATTRPIHPRTIPEQKNVPSPAPDERKPSQAVPRNSQPSREVPRQEPVKNEPKQTPK